MVKKEVTSHHKFSLMTINYRTIRYRHNHHHSLRSKKFANWSRFKAAGSVFRLKCLIPLAIELSDAPSAFGTWILGNLTLLLGGSINLLPSSSGDTSENFLEDIPENPFCLFLNATSANGSLIMARRSISSWSSSSLTSSASFDGAWRSGVNTVGAATTLETKTAEAVFRTTVYAFESLSAASLWFSLLFLLEDSQRISWHLRHSEHLWHQPSRPMRASSARQMACLHRQQLVLKRAVSVFEMIKKAP